MIEINPQEQLSSFQFCNRFGYFESVVDTRRTNWLRNKFANVSYSKDELKEMQKGLTGNEINPKKQPEKYELERLYGFVCPCGSLKVETKVANIWNDLDADLYRQSFAVQEECFYDLDKKYIW